MDKWITHVKTGVLSLIALLTIQDLHGASGAWTNVTTAQNWNVNGNWTGTSFPQSSGDAAGFVGIITDPFTVNLPTAITIGSIVLNTPNVNLTLGGTGPLNITDPSSSGTIIVGATDTLTFNIPVHISNSTNITGGSANGSAFVAFNQPISGGVGVSDTIIIEDFRVTATFAAPNSYVGRTVLNSGGLTLNGSGPTVTGNALFVAPFFAFVNCSASNQFSSSCLIDNNGFVNIGATSQTAGSLDNASGGTVTGSGTLTLTGNNEVISLNQGTLDLGTLILTGTNLSLAYRNSNGNSFNGQAFVGGSSPMTITPPIGQNLELNVTTIAVAAPPANPGFNSFFDLDLRNVIFSRGTLSKTGEGALLIEGTSTITPLTVTAGTIIMGRTGADTIAATGTTTVAGGSLIGNGTLGSGGGFTLSNTSGSVGAGLQTTPGTLTLSGNYSQGSGGTLSMKGLNAGANGADKLVVTNGTVQLNGTLSFTALEGSTFQPGDRITVLDNSSVSGITGTFSNFIATIPNTLSAKLIYNPTSFVIIEFLPGCSFSSNVDAFTDYVNLSIPLFAAYSERNVRLERRLYLVRDRMRVRTNPNGSVALSDQEYASADPLEKTLAFSSRQQASSFCDEACHPFSFYLAPLGTLGSTKNSNQQKGYDFHSWGVLAGSDYAFSRAGIGAQAGYEQFDANVNDNWGNFEIQNAFGKIYGTFLPICDAAFFIDLEVSGSKNWYSIDRNTSTSVAKGDPQGWSWDGYGSIGYDVFSKYRFTPLAGVQYIGLFVEDYDEEGAGVNDFQIAHQKFHSLRSFVGASFGKQWRSGSYTWLPEVRGYWEHEFEHINKQTDVALLLSDSIAFPVSNLVLTTGKRNYGTVGAELRVIREKNGKAFSFAAAYDYYWNNLVHANLFYGELDISY